ncbi:MAG: ATP-binding cassette domain-containing protein [Planctomycetes bacterium]|nr:ATP-binding cassette domain-containing protein [Planctomycetota bacterium]
MKAEKDCCAGRALGAGGCGRVAFERVDVAYHGRLAVRGVSLAVAPGRTLALVGPSGSGKSSLLFCVNRLIDLVDGATVAGRVTLDQRDVRSPEVDLLDLRRRVGMVFQRPTPFPFSIRRNLELPLQERGIAARSERADRLRAALVAVGLWDEVADRLERPATALSGGQQQRLCLARALVLEPEVLLLDEPCSALDPLAAAVVEESLAALKGRVTTLLVTHSLAQARRLADDVALLWHDGSAGTLAELQPTADFLGSPKSALARAFVAGAGR